MKTYSFHTFSADEAILCAALVVEIADKRELHGKVRQALREVKRTHKILAAHKTADEEEDDPLGVAADKPRVRDAMLAARTAFAALANALRAFSELPEGDETGDSARQAYAALYPYGTSFLNGTAVQVTARSGRVIDRAAEEVNAARLDAVGVAPLVKRAADAYRDLREAFAERSKSPTAEGEGDGRAALLEATSALREYARVVQAVDLLDDSSLQHELLAPFANRRAPKPRTGSAPEPVDAPELLDEVPPSRAA